VFIGLLLFGEKLLTVIGENVSFIGLLIYYFTTVVPPGIEATRSRTGDGFSPQDSGRWRSSWQHYDTRMVNRAGSYFTIDLKVKVHARSNSALRPFPPITYK